jgi:hypothetical protein
MSGNVIHLPRPRSQRPNPEGLGFYVRAGRNDHVTLLELLATGEEGISVSLSTPNMWSGTAT